jgi:hypothetical protein
MPFPVFEHLSGCPIPSNDGAAKFIVLTANLSGSGDFNEGLLINEEITANPPDATVPEIVATAEVMLEGSPLFGSVVPLINSMGVMVRPGELAGVMQGDAIRNITGNISFSKGLESPSADGVFGANFSNIGDSGHYTGNFPTNGNFDFDAARVVPTASENRMANISAAYYMRIK